MSDASNIGLGIILFIMASWILWNDIRINRLQRKQEERQ